MTNVIALGALSEAKAAEPEISLGEISSAPPDDQLDITLRRLLESRLYDLALVGNRIAGKLATNMTQGELLREQDELHAEISRIKRAILGAGPK